MIRIQNGSSTAVIIIHEIYGVNAHMKEVCRTLGEMGFDVFCPNLLGRSTFAYEMENEAYRFFMGNVGFSHTQRGVEALLADIRRDYEKLIVLGFSVGATVAWLCSINADVDGVVGYYGSRIRDYTELTPSCPVLLFSPWTEASFDIDNLITALQTKNVNLHKLEGEHGFSDPFSKHYNENSARKAFSKMITFIKGL